MDKQSPKIAGKVPYAMSVQVANNIIADHMKKAGFEYSLSVFLSEAGLNMDKVNILLSSAISAEIKQSFTCNSSLAIHH